MNLKSLIGIAGCSILVPLLLFAVILSALIALLIPQLPFGQEQAWSWFLGTPQAVQPPWVPSPEGKPIISGSGQWCVTRAYQESPAESHLNAGRVQGYVRDAQGNPLAGVPVHVVWDGCGNECITEYTRADGYYVAILSPGEYRVFIGAGQSQVVSFRTNLREYYGHYTYDVDFAAGSCFSQVGTYDNDPRRPHGWPANGPITARFHDPEYERRFGRIHTGLDIGVPVGTPLTATMNGKVIQAGDYDGWGNMVLIQNGPWEILVAHLSQIDVSLGQVVSAGTVLGLSGSTGFSTGPHVHYEIRYNGLPIDPQETY